MSKHYIADEKLGGVEREYVKVDRKAEVGDYVVVTKNGGDYVITYGKVIAEDFDKDDFLFDHIHGDYIEDNYVWVANGDRYKTLSPTENVRIDGAVYRLVDREPVTPEAPETQSLPSLSDIIATMARRLHEAESKISELTERLDSAEKDVRTFADGAMKTAYELSKHKAEQADMNEKVEDTIEMLTGDVVSLDERTQAEELAQTISKELAKGAVRRGLR